MALEITAFTILVACLVAVASVPAPAQVSPALVVEQDFRPYEFGYEFGDGLGMVQHRRETADGTGQVLGSYGYFDNNGVYRSVEYKADADGFRATVKSNEPGMGNQNPADVQFLVEPPPPAAIAQQPLIAAKTVVTEI